MIAKKGFPSGDFLRFPADTTLAQLVLKARLSSKFLHAVCRRVFLQLRAPFSLPLTLLTVWFAFQSSAIRTVTATALVAVLLICFSHPPLFRQMYIALAKGFDGMDDDGGNW